MVDGYITLSNTVCRRMKYYFYKVVYNEVKSDQVSEGTSSLASRPLQASQVNEGISLMPLMCINDHRHQQYTCNFYWVNLFQLTGYYTDSYTDDDRHRFDDHGHQYEHDQYSEEEEGDEGGHDGSQYGSDEEFGQYEHGQEDKGERHRHRGGSIS